MKDLRTDCLRRTRTPQQLEFIRDSMAAERKYEERMNESTERERMGAPLQTSNLELVPQTREDIAAMIDVMSPSEKAQLSADWLARFQACDYHRSVGARLFGGAPGQRRRRRNR